MHCHQRTLGVHRSGPLCVEHTLAVPSAVLGIWIVVSVWSACEKRSQTASTCSFGRRDRVGLARDLCAFNLRTRASPTSNGHLGSTTDTYRCPVRTAVTRVVSTAGQKCVSNGKEGLCSERCEYIRLLGLFRRYPTSRFNLYKRLVDWNQWKEK